MSPDGFIKIGAEIKTNIDDMITKKSSVILHSEWKRFHDELIKLRDGHWVSLSLLQEEIKKLKNTSIFAGQSLYQKACDDVLALLRDIP